jgi:hypothetical protein
MAVSGAVRSRRRATCGRYGPTDIYTDHGQMVFTVPVEFV